MLKRSVLIPQRDLGEVTVAGLPVLFETLRKLQQTFEVIIIDDASRPKTQDLLRSLLVEFPGLRVLWMKHSAGLSASLSVGIAAARGEEIIAIEPGNYYDARQIPFLLSHLSRADLVCGKRDAPAWRKIWRRVARTPRWGLMGLETRDVDCLFWAARSEALQAMNLTSGMHRYLPYLVAASGYRVVDVPVQTHGSSHLQPDRAANPIDLLAAWWTTNEITAETGAIAAKINSPSPVTNPKSATDQPTPFNNRRAA